jgi:hypothetical protein
MGLTQATIQWVLGAIFPGLKQVELEANCSLSFNTEFKAVPWLRRLVASVSPRKPGFDPGPVHVGFVVVKVALGQVFPRVLQFSPVSFIPPVLHYPENRKN